MMWGIQVQSLMTKRSDVAVPAKTPKEQHMAKMLERRLIGMHAQTVETMDKVLRVVKRCGRANAIMIGEQIGRSAAYARKMATRMEKEGKLASTKEKSPTNSFVQERWWTIAVPDMRIRETQDDGHARRPAKKRVSSV